MSKTFTTRAGKLRYNVRVLSHRGNLPAGCSSVGYANSLRAARELARRTSDRWQRDAAKDAEFGLVFDGVSIVDADRHEYAA